MNDQVETAEEQEPSIEETMGKAFDQMQEEPEAEVTEPEPESPPEPAAEVTEEHPATEEPAVIAEQEPTEQATAPVGWNAEAKAQFNSLPPLIQQEVLKRERDYSMGLEKNAKAAKLADEYEAVAAPYKAMIAAEGGTPVTAMQSLLNTAYQLRMASPEQKKALLMGIAQQYGVDLGSGETRQEDDVFVDPAIRATQERIGQLEGIFRAQQQQQEALQQQAVDQQINAFASDPANVHYEAVKADMAALLQSGRANSLKDAYDKAVWVNDATRQAILTEREKQAETERVEKAKKAAAEAKRAAGTNIKSRNAGETVAKAGSMEETLARKYDEMNS